MLSAADNPQRAVLRTPRVLQVVTLYLLPEGAKVHAPRAPGCLAAQRGGTGAESNIWGGEWSGGGAGAPVAGTSWYNPGGRLIGGRNEFSPLWGETPPCVSADVAARLLLAQLLPERPGQLSAALAMATSAAVSAAVAAAGRGRSGEETMAEEAAEASTGVGCSGVEFDNVEGADHHEGGE